MDVAPTLIVASVSASAFDRERRKVDWHERLGNPVQINSYLKALTPLRATRPATAGHHHKPGS